MHVGLGSLENLGLLRPYLSMYLSWLVSSYSEVSANGKASVEPCKTEAGNRFTFRSGLKIAGAFCSIEYVYYQIMLRWSHSEASTQLAILMATKSMCF